VVLARREHVEADLLGLLGDRDRVLDALVLGGRRAVHRVGSDVTDGEESELHGGHLVLLRQGRSMTLLNVQLD